MPSIAERITVTPLQHSSGFGAEVTNVDLNNLDDQAFKALERALYTHKLLVVRGQKDLLPAKQFELVRRFDPEAIPVHGHGNAKDVMKGFKGRKSTVGANPAVPDEPMVRMIGDGVVPSGHFGVTEPITLKCVTHLGYHETELSPEEMAKGETRFQRWHIDAPFYRTHPPKVTTLWAHTLPKGDDVLVRWDDGSEFSMRAAPGRTAFIDCARMYEALSDEDKAWVQHSRAEYAPSPYQWIHDCKALNNGFGVVSDGSETPYDELPSNEAGHIKSYPFLWVNPLTGEKALQVHQFVAAKLYIKTSPDGPEKVIDDVKEVREILDRLQRPFLTPEHILVAPQGEGDLCLWFNRGLRHTAIEYPTKTYGPRICHQVHVAGSDDPSNPKPLSA